MQNYYFKKFRTVFLYLEHYGFELTVQEMKGGDSQEVLKKVGQLAET